MNKISFTRLGTGLCAAALAGAFAGTFANAASDDAQSAVWVEKKLDFTYVGFTTKYSCDGLHDAVKSALLQLGARKKDLSVTESGCTRLTGPEHFPGVRVKMYVLQPSGAAAANTPAADKPVPAEWKTVKLKLDQSSTLESGTCELVEQIQKQILPLFSTRNVDSRTSCVPHQATPFSPLLQADVLVSAEKPKA